MKNNLKVSHERIEEILTLLDTMTDCEDIRQDTLLSIFTNGDTEDLSDLVERITKENNNINNLTSEAVSLMAYSDDIEEILSNFHPQEQSILVLLLLKFTHDQIAEYKNIDTVRLNQLIVSVSKHSCWEKIRGTKNSLDNRRTIWIDGRTSIHC